MIDRRLRRNCSVGGFVLLYKQTLPLHGNQVPRSCVTPNFRVTAASAVGGENTTKLFKRESEDRILLRTHSSMSSLESPSKKGEVAATTANAAATALSPPKPQARADLQKPTAKELAPVLDMYIL